MIVFLRLIRSPLFWIGILLATNAASVALWRHAQGRVDAVVAKCEQARTEAVNEALRAQAEGWETIYSAQQEAVTRMAAEAGAAAANARAWRERYETAKQTPACKAWSMQPVNCPIS
jgi:hypothetical protein